MNKKDNSLRAAAVEQLHQAPTTNSATRSAEKLLYELQVHQIELDMQNESLRQSYDALTESRQEYFELYEFAPVGYLTLSQLGLMEKINLTGATLLGEDRSQLLQRRFARYINATDANRWHLFFDQVMRDNQQKTLEVTLKQPNNNELCVQLCCLRVLDENKSPTLRIALTDMTKSKQAADLIIANIELAFQNKEKENRASELVIANVELAFQNKEKENRASELVIANVELAFQNKEKENRASELVIANIELTFQNKERELRAIERRKIEDALQKSELKLKFLLSNVPVTIFTCKPTPPFNPTYISPNINEILGYLPKKFLESCSSEQFLESCSSKQFLENCNFWEINIHPDDVAQVYDHLSQIFKNGTLQHECRFRTADGSYRWMYSELRFTRDQAGEPHQIIGFWVDINERKQIEKKLIESERHLRAILDTISECVKLIARDGTLLSINQSGLAMIGADSEDEVCYQSVYSLLAPEYRDAFQAFNEAVCDGKSGKMEFEMIGLKGTRHWVETHAVPFSLENGETVQLAVTQEITQRKQIEQQIIESHTLLRTIIDTVPVQIFWKDTNLCYVGGNIGFAKDAGMSCPEDLIGKDDYQMAWANQAELYRSDDCAVMKSGIGKFSYIEPVTIMNGVERWISTSKVPLKNQHNEVIGLLGVYEDITERKNAEMELRIAATIFESHTVGMMITDEKTHILKVNQAFTNLTGYSEAELLNQKPRLLHSGRQDRLFYDNLWQSIRDSGGWQGEIWNKRKNGDIYPELLTITAVRANQDQITDYVATHVDITERKAAEEEIRQLAFYDQLTGLPNRRKLLDRLHYSIALNHRAHSQFAVFMMDLDNFKAVNDSLGHAAGDELLKQVAARIIHCLRDSDMVARLGGDEFVLVLENLKIPEDAEIIASKVIAELTVPFQLSDNNMVQIGASIGISLYPQHGNTPESLMDRADSALYQAKDNGRGCFLIMG
ncbi:MAG: PAS domain S-box protein [Methylococcales bacterium]